MADNERQDAESVAHGEHWVTGYIRELGGCGIVNGDQNRVCILDFGHGGPHGFEAEHTDGADHG